MWNVFPRVERGARRQYHTIPCHTIRCIRFLLGHRNRSIQPCHLRPSLASSIRMTGVSFNMVRSTHMIDIRIIVLPHGQRREWTGLEESLSTYKIISQTFVNTFLRERNHGIMASWYGLCWRRSVPEHTNENLERNHHFLSLP
jgi:hypothetical protein